VSTDGLADDAPCARVVGEHHGYARPPLCAVHRRSVALDRQAASLTIRDEVSAEKPAPLRMFYHLHPEIGCTLSGATADLVCAGARLHLELPAGLSWQALHGSESPPLGWYSPAFDVKQAATTLVGEATLSGALALTTVVRFPAR
jgi:hypothetical protein